MKDFFKIAAIFCTGFLVGSTAEHLVKRKAIESLKKERDQFAEAYEQARKDYNESLKDNDQLRLDIFNCKALNRQVGTYAMQLKKNLDNFME